MDDNLRDWSPCASVTDFCNLLSSSTIVTFVEVFRSGSIVQLCQMLFEMIEFIWCRKVEGKIVH